MTRRSEADRGLGAVCRVREVRERDSRLGLQEAITDHRARAERAAAIAETLRREAEVPPDAIAAGEWVTHRTHLHALGDLAREAHQVAEAAAVLRTAAEERWRLDRTRLRAVEFMLEQRARGRREESDRRTAREYDDISGQRWLSRRSQGLPA